MTERIGVYPGSFDPIHLGHVDLIQRSRTLFDRTFVAVARNDEKKNPLFSLEERVEMVEDVIVDYPDCEVRSFSGLLVDFAEKVGGCTIIKGLRAVSDFEFEFQMALMNRRLKPNVETVFMMPKDDRTYISSRLIKEVCRLGGDITGLLPQSVHKRLVERLLEEG